MTDKLDKQETTNMPEEYVIGDDYGTPITYRLKSTVDAERAADSKTIVALAEALEEIKEIAKNTTDKRTFNLIRIDRFAKHALSKNAPRITEVQGVDRDKVKARQAKLTEILDAPAQDNPEIKELMEYKAPWEGIK